MVHYATLDHGKHGDDTVLGELVEAYIKTAAADYLLKGAMAGLEKAAIKEKQKEEIETESA